MLTFCFAFELIIVCFLVRFVLFSSRIFLGKPIQLPPLDNLTDYEDEDGATFTADYYSFHAGITIIIIVLLLLLIVIVCW